MMEQRETQSIVFVFDDDASLRDALSSLLRSVGLRVEAFGSAADFLKGKLPNAVSCLVLDIRLPGVGGLDFQAELAKAGIHIPIIFITGHGDIPMTVRVRLKLLKLGAQVRRLHFDLTSRLMKRAHSLFGPCSVTNFPLVPRLGTSRGDGTNLMVGCCG
jgi:DNA-binding response OmpR family regulator